MLTGSVTACGIAENTTAPPGVPAETAPNRASLSAGAIQQELNQAYEQWKGTPYVLGGQGQNGVDCSSFIQIVFDDHFDIRLPRNTREQIRSGSGVRRSSARAGDLIFFRTSRRDLHVGIMVNTEEFLHASTSSGVMISSTNEQYWATRFLGVRRIM